MRIKVLLGIGYAFSRNEEIRLYFKKQEWYQAEKVTLDLILTPIEKRKLATLWSVEAHTTLPKQCTHPIRTDADDVNRNL